MPGIGGSADCDAPYRLPTMARAAREIVLQYGYDEVDVVGVSWGGMLAQEFAYQYPECTGRLVLIATSAGLPMVPGRLSTLWKMLSSHRYTNALAMEPYLETFYGGTGDLSTYASRVQAPSTTGYLYQVLAIVGWTSVRKLTRVKSPTLILMGEEDRLVPLLNGRILEFLLDHARLEILPAAGHLLVLTHIEEAVSAVETFLGGHSPAAESVKPIGRIATSPLIAPAPTSAPPLV